MRRQKFGVGTKVAGQTCWRSLRLSWVARIPFMPAVPRTLPRERLAFVELAIGAIFVGPDYHAANGGLQVLSSGLRQPIQTSLKNR